ncbi:MAG: DEAD/DEAH box helicase [Anaerolineae bacterium]|nr:DEAD/DEAH box helicase [Anaerolineae bacterium]
MEATPVFKLGQTPHQVMTDLLGQTPDEGFMAALRGDRKLYRHQEEAIRRVTQGHNVVVATGTGSGKTESFLYPILLQLYREFDAQQLGAGVRALVLYPMNALANDQRDRLGAPPMNPNDQGGILHALQQAQSPFKFTFGQYIGQTPENADPNSAAVFYGEVATRAEMRQTPPHILLTNYSMLEYLLLRPNDSPLFDGQNAQTWRYIVLDEAHQYRGAKGIEMGDVVASPKTTAARIGQYPRFALHRDKRIINRQFR